MYRGIQMRSRLEAEYAAELDRCIPTPSLTMVRWDYEPMCFAGVGGQYLPDFRVDFRSTHGPHRVYIEVKPIVDDPVPLMRRMEIIWESEPDVQLTLVERRGAERTWAARAGSDWRRV